MCHVFVVVLLFTKSMSNEVERKQEGNHHRNVSSWYACYFRPAMVLMKPMLLILHSKFFCAHHRQEKERSGRRGFDQFAAIETKHTGMTS